MKTNNKISAYILRGSTAALLFSCVIVAVCSAINLPEQPLKVLPPQNNAAFGANGHESRTLTFADRVAYQSAIEDVYWRHRIWPDTNPGPKPPLDKVMSQAEIEKKVEDYLRNSQALEDYWQRPLTADQLQAEMERMAQHTKQADVLEELFEALGNDPSVIAECLARPVLAERLIADVSAQHETRRLESLRTAETQMPKKVAAIDSIAKAVQVNRPYHLPEIGSPSGGCIDDSWTATGTNNAPSARSGHTAVWTGSEMIVWGGFNVGYLNTGGRYNPSTDSWTATSTTNAPAGRSDHTAVWTGSEMIVWGGYNGSYLNTGGRYPVAGCWMATSTTNAPAGRTDHRTVLAGSEMIVWGGYNGSPLNTGGRYDPVADSWTATSTIKAPSARYVHAQVSTGNEVIVWGGYDDINYLNTGGRYDPVADSWTATSTISAPPARRGPRGVWTGSEMIVWGGFNGDGLNTGGRYTPGTDSWTATTLTNAPSGRYRFSAVWTGVEMIVWGGVNGPLNTGGRYCAAGPSPTPTPTPSPTPTATATATATAKATATATASPTPTATASPSATPRPSPSPRARPTPAPRP